MPHRRSKQAYIHRIETWEERKTPWQIANDVMLEFCFRDQVNRDKVFTLKFEKTIKEQLDRVFNNDVPTKVTYKVDNTEYGELLNLFPLRAFPLHQYVGRGSFQK